MKVHINCQVKNEEILLDYVIPFWLECPIDKFVFFNTGSTDNTTQVIHDYLGDGDDIMIFNRDLDSGWHPSVDFNESRSRSTMMEYSRHDGADVVISIDADELLSDSIVRDFDWLMKHAAEKHLHLYQYNVVGNLTTIRQDPAYDSNYRDFLFPMKHVGEFDLTKYQYHTPRTPPIDETLDDFYMKDYGFVHLQALNVRFYALKQLWYKTYEYKEYGKSIEEINNSYDPVVNGLDFCETEIQNGIIGDHWIDPPFITSDVFDKIIEQRGWIPYIQEHAPPELITFGKEYL